MAGTRGSTNGSGAGTRTARGAAEGRAGAGARAHAAALAASPYGRAIRRTMTIGEAAAVLSAEFPGVTAAVLRRLEAAGQFVPARSTSGYRRYSDADLDLIRIVLANQSAQAEPVQAGYPAAGAERATRAGSPDPADLSGAEHLLTHPAAGQSGAEAEDALAAMGAARDRGSGAARHSGHPGPQGAAAGRTTARGGRAASSRVPAARTAVAEDMQGAASRYPAARRPTTEALFDVPEDGGAGLIGAGSTVRGGQGAAGLDLRSQRPDPGELADPETAAAASAKAPTGSVARASAPGAAATPNGAVSTAASRRAERRWPDPEFFAPDLGEVALDRDQLAAAARTDRAWVDGLVEYGLLSGNRSAGGADLLVARAAAELAQFGMEPRHLRAVAASAARVAELIASATSPGAARDTARRERALLAAPGRSAEAAAAAVRLHAALVRAALLRG